MEQTGLIRSRVTPLTAATSEIGEDVSPAGWSRVISPRWTCRIKNNNLWKTGCCQGIKSIMRKDEIRELGDECLNLRTTYKTNSAVRCWFIEKGVAFLSWAPKGALTRNWKLLENCTQFTSSTSPESVYLKLRIPQWGTVPTQLALEGWQWAIALHRPAAKLIA